MLEQMEIRHEFEIFRRPVIKDFPDISGEYLKKISEPMDVYTLKLHLPHFVDRKEFDEKA